MIPPRYHYLVRWGRLYFLKRVSLCVRTVRTFPTLLGKRLFIRTRHQDRVLSQVLDDTAALDLVGKQLA